MLHEQILESRGVAAVVVDGFIQPIDDQPWVEDTGIGYMEYFDWLAGCSDTELLETAPKYDIAVDPSTHLPLSAAARNHLGSVIWSRM